MKLQVGDVLFSRSYVTTDKAYGRVWMNTRWLPISFEPNAPFLVLSIKELLDNAEVEANLLSLDSGTRFLFALSIDAIATKLTVLRGKSVVVTESCGTVGS